jgi:hypothetical protein
MDQTDVFAICPDQADFRGADALVDPWTGIALWLRCVEGAACQGRFPLAVDIGRDDRALARQLQPEKARGQHLDQAELPWGRRVGLFNHVNLCKGNRDR